MTTDDAPSSDESPSTGGGPWREEGDDCRRCGNGLQTPFCPQCGQAPAQRLTSKRPLHDLGTHVLSLNSTWARTFIGLWKRPGTVIQRYLAGDRSGYVNPAKYTFLAATLYAVLITVLEVDVRPQTAISGENQEKALAATRLVVSMLGYMIFIYLLPTAERIPAEPGLQEESHSRRR